MPNVILLDPPVEEAADYDTTEPAVDLETRGDSPTARPAVRKAYLLSTLCGVVGAVLALAILWLPIHGGDFTAAVSLLPLTLGLIALANAWAASFIFFLGSDSET